MLRIRGIKIYFFHFVFLLFLIPISPCQASNDEKQILDTIERQRFIENLKRQQQGINSITAIVYQEKHLSLLKKDIHIKGTVTLMKPNMLRWETVSPERSITVVDGKTMTVYHLELKEVEVYNLSNHFIARNTMSFFVSVMWGSLKEMEKRFIVNIFYKNSGIVLELTPSSKMVARYLSSIIILYNEKTGLPEVFEVTTPKGDRTVTKLTDIKVNPELTPDNFTIKLPSDVQIENNFDDEDY